MSKVTEALSLRLKLPIDEVRTLISTAPYRYKVYQIPKRNGKGLRTIAQPAGEIKLLQSAAISFLLNTLPIHEAAVAYRRGRSTRSHVTPHLDSSFLLKLDFKDFFPSIVARDILAHLAKYTSFDNIEQQELCSLLTYRNKLEQGPRRLSIGAPSSPFLSNSLLFELDTRIFDYCQKHSIAYTRYADDLALSSKEPDALQSAQAEIERLLRTIEYPSLKINSEKTVNVSKGKHRSLVGLNITPEGKASVGRDKKRLIRAKLHRYILGTLTPNEIGALRGELAYLLSVEREFIESLAVHYGKEPLQALQIPTSPSKPQKNRAQA